MLNQITDHKGRYLSEILGLSDFWIEHDHEFIQWLFPVARRGRFNTHSPTVTKEDIELFSSSKRLQTIHTRCLDRMLTFYGLMRLGGSLAPVEPLTSARYSWLRSRDHNHLRITRILKSLFLLGQPDLAKSLSSEFERVGLRYGDLERNVFVFWRDAVDSAEEERRLLING